MLAYPCETDLVSVFEVLNCLLMVRDAVFQICNFHQHTCTILNINAVKDKSGHIFSTPVPGIYLEMERS
jgi:hypothetical protein